MSLLFIVQLLAAAAVAATSCRDSECDGHGMLQMHVDNHGSEKRPESGKAAAAADGSTRPHGRKFTPDVWAPKFEAPADKQLQLECRGESFVKCWTFFTSADPTHGYVQYISEDEATELKLFKVQQDGAVWMGSLVGQDQPVKAIRLQSKMRFSEGHIFVIDIQHMPTGNGTWPAWWSYGPDWPNNGEIDTIETVNIEDRVYQTLHTSYGCFMNIPHIFDPDCNSEDAHNGCGLHGPPNSGGPAFNKGGGGVFATQWTSAGIQMWVFPRGQVPKDLAEDKPDSSSWGSPWAFFPFGASCPSTHFNDHLLVINLDFCGDWAGAVFPGGEKACEAFVTDPSNIDKLQEAYWSINYVKVFAPEPATKSQAKSEKTATKTQTQSAKEKVVRKGEKMEEIKTEAVARKENAINHRSEQPPDDTAPDTPTESIGSGKPGHKSAKEKIVEKGQRMKDIKTKGLKPMENIINHRSPKAPDASTQSTRSERPELLQDQDQQESSKQKVLQKAAKMKKLKMERLASRENIINRRIQQSSVPVAPETSANSTMSERPQLLQDQDQQESSKQKVLQKAAKMKKLKMERLASREIIINRRIEKLSVPAAPETSTNSTGSEKPQMLQESAKQKVLQKAAKMKERKKERLARMETIINRRLERKNGIEKYVEG